MSRDRFKTLRNDLNKVEKDWFQQMENMKADDNKTMIELERKLDTELKRRKQNASMYQSTLAGGSDLAVLSLRAEVQNEEKLQLTAIRLPLLIHLKQSEYTLPDSKELIGEPVRKPRSEISYIVPRTVNKWTLIVLVCSISIFLVSIIFQKVFVPTFDADMIEVITLKTFRDRGAAGIVHTRTDDFWINNRQKPSTLSLFSYNFNLLKEIEMDFTIEGIVLTNADGMLATDANGERVVKISNEGLTNTLLNTAPLYPCGMCIYDQQEAVVALSKGKTFSLVTFSPTSSTELHEIKEVTSLFDFQVYAVQQNGNGDYIASGYEGVICVTRDGEYRWKYDSICSSIQGLVCERHDNIIIAEYATNKIILLNSEGKLIKTLMTEDDRIWRPLSLSIDSKGFLWVGQISDIKIVQYIK